MNHVLPYVSADDEDEVRGAFERCCRYADSRLDRALATHRWLIPWRWAYSAGWFRPDTAARAA